jgi:hypothetical protein
VPASESPEYRRLHDELAQAQADLTRQIDQARRRRSHRMPRRFRPGPRMWVLKWIIFPVATALLLLVGAIQFGPALAAAEGHGTAGYFVAEVENCEKGRCGWTGNFVAPDGRVTLRNVGFMGPHGTLYRGARLAALDTGDGAEVYARHGSHDWMADLAFIVVGVIGFGLWAWRVPYRTARRRVRRDGSGNWHAIASLATRCLEGFGCTIEYLRIRRWAACPLIARNGSRQVPGRNAPSGR